MQREAAETSTGYTSPQTVGGGDGSGERGKMYLLIFEDGEIQTVDKIEGDTMGAADDGYVDIIDISGCDNPLQYSDGEWHPASKSG